MSYFPLRSVAPVRVPLTKVGEPVRAYEVFINRDLPADTEICCDCSFADLVVGESVVAGTTTRGAFEMGVYLGASPGRFLNFDGSQEGSLLWGDLSLIRGSLATMMIERQKNLDNMPLKRTDSGTNYGFTGYPDVAFWARSGIVADMTVPTEIYGSQFALNISQQSTGELEREINFRQRTIQHLREINASKLTQEEQLALNKQAGEYTERLEKLYEEKARR